MNHDFTEITDLITHLQPPKNIIDAFKGYKTILGIDM